MQSFLSASSIAVKTPFKRAVIGVAAVVMAVQPEVGNAAGLAIFEQSPSGFSVATSNAAEAADASVLWYNPAGLTFLDGISGVMGATYLLGIGDFDNDLSRSSSSAGGAAMGGDGGDFGIDAPIPVMYAAYELSLPMKTVLGLGVTSPFGLGTDYDRGWVGRYDALKSKMLTFNANPSLAVQLNDYLSVGAGFNVQYVDVNLTQAIDTGAFFGAFAADDSIVKLRGDSFGWGYNFGLMFQPNERLRLGASFRSKVEQDVDGRARFVLSPSGAAISMATGALVDTGISSTIEFPETVSVHGYYQATDRLAVMSDLTWTNWSRIKSIPIKFDNPLQPTQTLTVDFHDTIRVAAGASFKYTDALTLRVGGAFDQSPQPTSARGFRLPDNDRWVIGAGAAWQASPYLKFGGAYQFVYVEEADVDVVTPTGAGPTFNRAAGSSNLQAHFFVVEGSLNF